MKISSHFDLSEFTNSATALRLNINNTPNDQQIKNITKLVLDILEPIRARYGRPIIINSGFRCQALNKAVGGSSTSDHLSANAADICAASKSEKDNLELYNLIVEQATKFHTITCRQIIWEYGHKKSGPAWIHVSCNIPEKKQKTNELVYIGVK